MLIKDIDKRDYNRLKSAYNLDCDADFDECWGSGSLENMKDVFSKFLPFKYQVLYTLICELELTYQLKGKSVSKEV